MPHSEIAILEARVDEYQEAMATFARLHAELADLRDNIVVPEAVDRIEAMLRFNAETAEAIKGGMTKAIVALRHAQARALQPA